MIVGITGTRVGMTEQQRETLRHLLCAETITGLVHGGAPGADEQVDELFREVRPGPPQASISIWPATGATWKGPKPDYMYEPEEPLSRNEKIVLDCDLMLVIPRQPVEIKGRAGGGTWATYRYALRAGRMTLVIRPDGSIRPASSPARSGVE